ncbi:MAG TPA: HAD-IIIA family hydrolase [Candidatus Acidoferrales bacterium]|nr:HAD-IIIA family hydrolase [Candidatus Acidoferrales bacterium]
MPYNGDPALVEPIVGAKAALDRLRAAGLKVGVLTNQSAVGRGMITGEQMRAVNARVEQLLGPFDGWFVCPHAPGDDCECRKPKPKLIYDAAHAWGLDPSEIVVIGDKPSDVEAARNAGARPVLVGEKESLPEAGERILRD